MLAGAHGFAHTTELRAKLNADGSATFYARTYHSTDELPSGGFIIDGITYPFQGFVAAAELPAGTILISSCPDAYLSAWDHYQYVTLPAFNSCGAHTFDCTTNAQETPWCTLASIVNLGGPQITEQPAFGNGAGCAGGNGSLHISASGNALQFQWQADFGNGFVDLTNDPKYSGVITNQLNIIAITGDMSGIVYRCVVNGKDDCGHEATVYSSTAVLYPSVQITSEPMSVQLCGDYYTQFTVAAMGNNLQYQWQASTDSGQNWSDLPGEINPQLFLWDLSAADSGHQYRVVVSGNCAPAAISQVATLTYGLPPQILQQPVDAVVCEGNPAVFIAQADGDSLRYQWQTSSDYGFSWNDMDGADSGSFSFPAVLTNDYILYRATVTGKNGCTVTSDNVMVQVAPVEALMHNDPGATSIIRNSWFTVDSTITIDATTQATVARITIIENFSPGDLLQLHAALPNGVAAAYDSTRGIFTVQGTLSPLQLQQIFRNMQIRVSNTRALQRRVAFSIGEAIPAANGHYYAFVPGNINWSAAATAAGNKQYYGMQGYLASITCQAEHDELRQLFPALGDTILNRYETIPDSLALPANDTVPGYLVEYGGMPGDPCTKPAAEKTILIYPPPVIAAIADQDYCADAITPILVKQQNAGYSKSRITTTSNNSQLLPEGSLQLQAQTDSTWLLQLAPAGSGAAQVMITITNEYGDTAAAVFQVRVHPKPVAGFTVNASSQCLRGNNFVFSNTSSPDAGNLQYSWSFGDGHQSGEHNAAYSYQSTGQYPVQLLAVSDQGCADRISQTITVLGTPDQPGIRRNATVLSSTPATAYKWFMNNQLLMGTSQGTLQPQLNGFYQVQVSDANGCLSQKSDSVYYQFAFATVSPNPAVANVTVRFSEPDAAQQFLVEIYDARGKLLQQVVPAGNHQQIDLSGLANAIYYFRIVPRTSNKVNSGQGQTIKVVKVGR